MRMIRITIITSGTEKCKPYGEIFEGIKKLNKSLMAENREKGAHAGQFGGSDSPPSETPGVTRGNIVSSEALFEGGIELAIEHNGELYRLRKTRLGKLILTK